MYFFPGLFPIPRFNEDEFHEDKLTTPSPPFRSTERSRRSLRGIQYAVHLLFIHCKPTPNPSQEGNSIIPSQEGTPQFHTKSAVRLSPDPYNPPRGRNSTIPLSGCYLHLYTLCACIEGIPQSPSQEGAPQFPSWEGLGVGFLILWNRPYHPKVSINEILYHIDITRDLP